MSPQGSVLIEMGNTKVICTATVEEATAKHLTGTGRGWITAEYSMLPGSTATRKKRDRGKTDGRSVEIQRLIGRSLRSVADMDALGERTIWIDCDVIQADGGTRTASITGAFVAMVEAMKWMTDKGMIDRIPVKAYVSAVSVGVIDQEPCLDLCYQEDSKAIVDMNVVMTESGKIVEIQGTAERAPFSRAQFNELMDLAEHGLKQIFEIQRKVIAGEEPEKNESKKSELGRMSDAFSGINL